jgi:hypothetical protein
MEFERHLQFISRVEVTCRRMDDEADAAERGFPFESSHHIVRDTHDFICHAERELPGMDHELPLLADGQFFHHVVDRLFGINAHVLFGAKREKIGAEMEINGCRLDRFWEKRRDTDPFVF